MNIGSGARPARKLARRGALLIAALVFATPLIAPAQSGDPQARISAMRAGLAQQAEADTAALAAADRADIAGWLDDAESLLRAGDRDQATRLIQRAEVGLDLVRQLALVSQIQGQAERQEKTHSEAVAQIAALRQEIATLQAQQRELEQELRTLR